MQTDVAQDILREYHDIATDEAIEIGETIRRIKSRIGSETSSRIPFPIDCLPDRLADFIRAYMQVYDVPADHYGLCFLVAAGAAIGNTARINDRGTDHPAVIYGALVDLPGAGKTPTLKTVFRPFHRREMDLRREYAAKVLEASTYMAQTGQEVKTPKPEQLIFDDFTLESLVDGLQASPRGVVCTHDELDGFLSSMDKYRSGKGGDGPFWLAAHTGQAYKNNRRNREHPVYLPRVFCPFVGGIQPGLLNQFSNDNRASSGFLARILFSIPERSLKQNYHSNRPALDHAEHWDRVVNRLFDLRPEDTEVDSLGETRIQPWTVEMSDKAQSIYGAFYNALARRVNDCDDTVTRSTLVKFETHCLRFALILHFLEWASATSDPQGSDTWLSAGFIDHIEIVQTPISDRTMKAAVQISEYFMATGLFVVGRLAGPHRQLPEPQKIWYQELSEEPGTAEAVEAAKAAGFSEATAKRLLNNKDLFKRLGRGRYLKLHLLH